MWFYLFWLLLLLVISLFTFGAGLVEGDYLGKKTVSSQCRTPNGSTISIKGPPTTKFAWIEASGPPENRKVTLVGLNTATGDFQMLQSALKPETAQQHQSIK